MLQNDFRSAISLLFADFFFSEMVLCFIFLFMKEAAFTLSLKTVSGIISVEICVSAERKVMAMANFCDPSRLLAKFFYGKVFL